MTIMREHGKNVRLKIYTEISWDNISSNKYLKHAVIRGLNFFYTLSSKKEEGHGRISEIPGMKFSLPEIQGIFQMFQSRLKGYVCRAGMATMLIGGEFRMRGGYSTGTNAKLDI